MIDTHLQDLIGGFRPIRGKDAAIARFRVLLKTYYALVRANWAAKPADQEDAATAAHQASHDSMEVEQSGAPQRKAAATADGDSDDEGGDRQLLPPMPSAALPQEAREWLPLGEVSISDAETKGSRASVGWIDGADVLDLVAQFENSWESVGALLPRLMRHQTMGEDPAEDEAQGLWQQLKEAALLVEEQVPNCRALFTWYDGPLVTGKR